MKQNSSEIELYVISYTQISLNRLTSSIKQGLFSTDVDFPKKY